MTKQYPSQKNRKPVLIDAGLHQDMKDWCKKNNISMKAAVEAFARMCLDGEIKVLVKVKSDND